MDVHIRQWAHFGKEGKTMSQYSALKPHLRGELIQPGDSNYDDARKLYNAMIDKKPAAIACCIGHGRLHARCGSADDSMATGITCV